MLFIYEDNTMRLKLFPFLFIFFTNFITAQEVQYFIPKNFYESPFTISLGGGQNHFYSPGKLFEEAINIQNKNSKVLKKCTQGEKSRKIIKFIPNSFYNPQLNVFQTDLRLDFLNQKGEVLISEKITHKTVTIMAAHEKEILKHYKELVDKLIINDILNASEDQDLIGSEVCY